MNKKGFTLVELLAVIAILAILVIIALPNVIKLYNNAKKNAFLTEVKTLSKEVTNKYIKEFTKGKRIKSVSNKNNSLALNGRELDYYFNLDDDGSLLSIYVSDGNYCVSSSKNYSELTIDDISNKCTYTATAGTLMKKFYEKSGRTDRSQVESLVFYSDGRTIAGTDEVYDVSEAQDNQIKMYVKENSDSTLLDLIIVGNGKIYLPKDSSELFKLTICGSGCYRNFKSIEFNDSIDTSKVTDMSAMFEGNTFEKLDLSSFDTSKVTDMSYMFSWSDATTLDLSSFDTSKVTDMKWMFRNCYNLKTIYVSDKFNTLNVNDSYLMFDSVYDLVGGSGTVYDHSKTDATYARIDGGTSNPGYFTLKTN